MIRIRIRAGRIKRGEETGRGKRVGVWSFERLRVG